MGQNRRDRRRPRRPRTHTYLLSPLPQQTLFSSSELSARPPLPALRSHSISPVNMSVRVVDVLMFLSKQENKQRYQRLEDSAESRMHAPAENESKQSTSDKKTRLVQSRYGYHRYVWYQTLGVR